MLSDTDGLTPDEEHQLLVLLKKVKGGPLSTPVFAQLARITPQVAIETVILRKKQGWVQILLTKRSDIDLHWPGMYHSPGQIARLSDYFRLDLRPPYYGAFDRVQNLELNRIQFVRDPIFVGASMLLTERGPVAALAFYAEIPENAKLPKDAMWYDTHALCKLTSFVQHQRPMILHVVQMAKENNFWK